MEDRFEQFTVLIARINRAVRRIKAEEMADFGLKGPHVSCLYYLSVSGELTAAELCERCEEDKAAVSRSLEELEQLGYVTCRSSGRRYRAPLGLTEKGRRLCRALTEKVGRVVAEASAGLTEPERQTMYRALSIISGNLEAHVRRRQAETAGTSET